MTRKDVELPIVVTVDQGVTTFRTTGVTSSYELATTIVDFYEG